MEGLNRAAGAPVPFEWNGKKYVLDRFTLGDWAYLEECFLKRKRRLIVKQATDLKGILDAAEYRELLAEKIKEAATITEVSNEEMSAFMAGGLVGGDNSPAKDSADLNDIRGMVFFMVAILDRRYPGEFTEADMINMLANGDLGEQHMTEFMLSFQQLQGSSGNSTSRPDGPAEAVKA